MAKRPSIRQTNKQGDDAHYVISTPPKKRHSSPLEVWLIFTALIWGVFFLSMVHNWGNRESPDSDLEVEKPSSSLLSEPSSHDQP